MLAKKVEDQKIGVQIKEQTFAPTVEAKESLRKANAFTMQIVQHTKDLLLRSSKF